MRHARTLIVGTTLLSAVLSISCNRGGSSAAAAGGGRGGRGGGPPAVTLLTLQEKPIEQASEFIATLSSLRTTTIQPEVEGVVTRIFVKPGDRVRVGTPLVQINADKQQAAVRSTEASQTGTEADVQYWRQLVTRLEPLVEAGAISRQEFEQAQNSLRTAEARLNALQAQVREGRVELQYYRVNAPQAGVVGDITIRVGDRVTNSTAITTIDDNSALDADIQVPLDRTPDLKIGLPVQLLAADGKPIATNPITFVAPRVDERTQTVLVKSRLKDAPPALRVQQFSRARIIWKTAPGLLVPLTAVVRINGKFFCYVAEPKGEALIANQRPVDLGELVGNDYVVRSGLKPGEQFPVQGLDFCL